MQLEDFPEDKLKRWLPLMAVFTSAPGQVRAASWCPCDGAD